MIEVGKLYEFPEGEVFECLKVSFFGALMRSLDKRTKTFETRAGEVVEFDAPGRLMTISEQSILKEVEK